jgi:hypothetical protein
MFQTSEAPRRSRGTHGGAWHGVVLQQSDKRRRTRSSRRPYRRAQHRRRESGRCPATPPGRPKALPGPLILAWPSAFRRSGGLLIVVHDGLRRNSRSARRTPPARQEPLVLSRGDFEATCWVGPVGLVGPVRRVPGCRVRRRPVLARTRHRHDRRSLGFRLRRAYGAT